METGTGYLRPNLNRTNAGAPNATGEARIEIDGIAYTLEPAAWTVTTDGVKWMRLTVKVLGGSKRQFHEFVAK